MKTLPCFTTVSLLKRMWTLLLCAAAVLGMVAEHAGAQDYRAKLTVTVTDTTGAVIPSATLELKRGSTGLTTPAKTNAVGTFIFQFLEPDTYSLKASAPGMNTQEVIGIVLQSYASTSVSVQLKPAGTTTQVTVTSEGALLQTETASRAWNIENKTIEALPVINGNPVMLGNNIPGVYMRPLGIYTDPWTVTSQFLINGGLMYLNEFQIDGSPNDAQLGANTYAYTPPQFAVKEFAVSANNYDAQYGHTSGGVINLTTLSGTDALHGIGWSSFRRTGWNANTYQNKYQNAIHNTNKNGTPFNSQTQLGFQVGGPVYIPHVIGKSQRYKPYFFFAFDHYSELLPRGLLLSYPTAQMRTGDFSQLLNQPGYPAITIYDPESVHQDNTGKWVRDPFSGNIIPQGRISPVAQAVAKLLPPVGSTPSGERIGTNNLNIPNNYFNWHFHNLLGRFDFNIGDKYKFFLRPFMADFTEVSNAGGIVGPGENGGHFTRASKGFLFDFVDVINPTTVLNVRYGYTLFRVIWTSPPNQGFDLTSLGLPSSFTGDLQQPALFGNWTFQGYNSMGWFANTQDTGTYSIEDDLSKTIGRHNIRMGSDVRLTHFTFINPGSFTLANNSDWTQAIYGDPSTQSYSGDGFATFLLGTPSSGNTTINANQFVSTWYLAPWLQDDWRITPRLTINLGIRYDVLTAPVDKNNALNIGFNPSIPNAVQSQVPASAISLLPQAASLTGGLVFADVAGNPRSPFATVYHNIQPRIGFAWEINNRLVARGGYGLFYTNFQNNGMLQQRGFSSSTPLTTSNDGGIHPISSVLSNPYPGGLVQPTGSSLGTLTGVGTALSAYNTQYKIPSANQFSLGFQYRLLQNGVLDASYVGNRVVGYDMNYDANMPNWNFQQTCDEVYGNGKFDNCFNTQLPNPFKGVPAFRNTSYYNASTFDAYDLNRPHPEFQTVTVSGLNEGHNYYNGLQVDYQQRMSHGFSFDTSYVWSKQIEQWGWMNQALNLRQRSPYYLGLPHVFKINGVYQLPVGRDRMFNLRGNRIADAIIGGWDFSPQLVVQSGEPAALPANAYPLPHNQFYKHPDWSKVQVQGWNNCVLSKYDGVISIPGGPNGAMAKRCGSDFSKYDWVMVPVLPNERAQPSNSSAIRMRRMILSDAALQKSVRVREGVNVILRLSASNVLNHFNILTARFDTNPNDGPNFGTIYPGETPTADSPPRNVNVQIRVAF